MIKSNSYKYVDGIDPNATAASINKITANTNSIKGNDFDIAANTNLITQNTSKAQVNTQSITSNLTKINTNTTNIAANTTNITENAGRIASNAGNITGLSVAFTDVLTKANTNKGSITSNLTKINTNTTNIATNTTNITENAGRIASNAGNITGLSMAFTDVLTKANANKGSIDVLQAKPTWIDLGSNFYNGFQGIDGIRPTLRYSARNYGSNTLVHLYGTAYRATKYTEGQGDLDVCYLPSTISPNYELRELIHAEEHWPDPAPTNYFAKVRITKQFLDGGNFSKVVISNAPSGANWFIFNIQYWTNVDLPT